MCVLLLSFNLNFLVFKVIVGTQGIEPRTYRLSNRPLYQEVKNILKRKFHFTELHPQIVNYKTIYLTFFKMLHTVKSLPYIYLSSHHEFCPELHLTNFKFLRISLLDFTHLKMHAKIMVNSCILTLVYIHL